MNLEPPTTTEDGDVRLGDMHFACPPYASVWIHGWDVRNGVVLHEGRSDIHPWPDEKRQQHDQQIRRSQARFAFLLRRVPLRRVRRRYMNPGAPWQVTIESNAFINGDGAARVPPSTEPFTPFTLSG